MRPSGFSMLWSARQTILDRLCEVPELFRTPNGRLRTIAFDVALALYEAKQLRDYPLSRWEHIKMAFRLR